MKRLSLLVFLALPALILAQDLPTPPDKAAGKMTALLGFDIKLFAGEPDVVQPIAFTFDDRGRLWVVECLSYPNWRKDGKGNDRVVIFEDTDGDGKFDKRTVFYDKGSNLSGMQYGFGGIWLCSLPNLIYIPIKPGTDEPAGPPQILLDGWDVNNAGHNAFNSLTWGPDGWLWGCNGIQSNGLVGHPTMPKNLRTPMKCGVWRFHPTEKIFEPVAHGTTNPWGLDFDDYGEAFITNCVIAHLWHVVPGADFQRMYGEPFNPHHYQLMETCADHIHWGGGSWGDSRGGKGKHDSPGGGHAHVGCMVYLGDNWPKEQHNRLFTLNLHGSRLNQDILERKGSGYVATHGPDLFKANDQWFRGLAVADGPDGGVFVTDWYDTGECHNYKIVDRTNGRIYKITHGKTTPWTGDLAKLSDAELVKLQLHPNDWHVRHARRILQERSLAGKLAQGTEAQLHEMVKNQPDVLRKLRALWALHGVDRMNERQYGEFLQSPEELLRTWALRLLLTKEPSATVMPKIIDLAVKQPSPAMRLNLASGLQRLSLGKRWPLVEELIKHGEDAKDTNLTLMLWYGMEPLAAKDPARAAALIPRSSIPLIREFSARRIASLTEGSTKSLDILTQLLSQPHPADVQRDILRGMQAALAGRKKITMPEAWPAAFAKLREGNEVEVRLLATEIGLIFGDPHAVTALRQSVAGKGNEPPREREAALRALVQHRDRELVPLLFELLKQPSMRGPALRGLSAYSDPETPKQILVLYAQLTAIEKADAINTLAVRPAYARALVEAMEKATIPTRDVDAFTVRQLHGLNDKDLSSRLEKVWGVLRSPSQERVKEMAGYKKKLTPDALKEANLGAGRQLFAKTCASCHTLFGEGGKVGPELTGGQRFNLDYLLENMLDPSAQVANEYRVTVITTADGRTLNGIIKREDKATVALQTPNDLVILAKQDIDSRKQSKLSLMPDGVLATLRDEEVRDLVGYLMSPRQVELPKQR